MIKYLQNIINKYTIPRKRTKWAVDIAKTIVTDIFPNEAWHYNVSPSFMQLDDLDLNNPVSISIMLPDIPLAIDILWEKYDADYRNAKHYIGRQEWEVEQKKLSRKINRLAGVQRPCPYIIIREYQPTDVDSLKKQIRSVIGSYKGWK